MAKHNDDERRQWVDNDEYLYREAKRFRGGVRAYIRENRATIDAMIDGVADGTRRQHDGPNGRYLD